MTDNDDEPAQASEKRSQVERGTSCATPRKGRLIRVHTFWPSISKCQFDTRSLDRDESSRGKNQVKFFFPPFRESIDLFGLLNVNCFFFFSCVNVKCKTISRGERNSLFGLWLIAQKKELLQLNEYRFTLQKIHPKSHSLARWTFLASVKNKKPIWNLR